MSVTRPLARAARATRAVGTGTGARASSSLSNNSNYKLPAIAHTPSYPMYPVPRSPLYPTVFKDQPLHRTINYPEPLLPEYDEAFEKLRFNGDNSRETTERVAAVAGYTVAQMNQLEKAAVVSKRVVVMTKLGKIPSRFVMMVVGDPEKGLVGIGRGRGMDAPVAFAKAFNHGVLNMDYVDKFENRTLWGQGKDLTGSHGATTVIMRARPAGFGLQVPWALHRLFSACGIRDASATIEGSRNPLNVLNAAIQILHGGFGPPGFGSGDGRGGRFENKGKGMRSLRQIELDRGRHGVDIGKRF